MAASTFAVGCADPAKIRSVAAWVTRINPATCLFELHRCDVGESLRPVTVVADFPTAKLSTAAESETPWVLRRADDKVRRLAECTAAEPDALGRCSRGKGNRGSTAYFCLPCMSSLAGHRGSRAGSGSRRWRRDHCDRGRQHRTESWSAGWPGPPYAWPRSGGP